jgi:hypothetical protein
MPWIIKQPKRRSRPQPYVIGPRVCACTTTLYGADIFRNGLRFDPRYRFMTGEDSDLAHRIADAGGKVFATDQAVVHEEVPPERCTLRYQLARQFAFAQGNTEVFRDRNQYISVLREASLYGFQACTSLFSAIIAGGVTFSRKRFKKRFLRAAQKTAYVAGIASSLRGHRFEPYRTVVGR